MNAQQRSILMQRWLENERDLARLAELPVGDLDPCERERILLAEQESIECVLALANLTEQGPQDDEPDM